MLNPTTFGICASRLSVAAVSGLPVPVGDVIDEHCTWTRRRELAGVLDDTIF